MDGNKYEKVEEKLIKYWRKNKKAERGEKITKNLEMSDFSTETKKKQEKNVW